tara:strand:+ start:4954 stop:6516 length:1563 start_codon:yes stop_codon:yes gene_type:complete
MKLAIPTPTLITILPILAFLPVSKELIENAHLGGLTTFSKFVLAAFTPSIAPIVIKSSLHGLQVTVATALLSWTLSILLGTVLGIISSNTVWKAFGNFSWASIFIRRLLFVPRAIHEVIWGLLLLQILGLTPWVAVISLVIPYSSLMARVVADQLDTIDNRELVAVIQVGAKPSSALITSLLPKSLPILSSYYGYRLECTLRGATILGIFGLGGIGTELQLTLQSLQFNEMWTALWMLAVLMILLERSLNWLRNSNLTFANSLGSIQNIIFIIFSTIGISLIWLHLLDINLFEKINLNTITWPQPIEIKNALFELPLRKLILDTLLITLLSAGMAIGTPPLALILSPNHLGREILDYIWVFFRLIPAPLVVLLFLLFSTPSISIASLSLGVNNMGVMGRLLKENIKKNDDVFNAIKSCGASDQAAWLYGKLAPTSKIYLAFAAYRTDVILRETAVIGVAGGIGLGWQLKESLSSFDWSQVAVITASFTIITLFGEFISDQAHAYWIRTTTDDSLQISTQA